MAEPCSRGNMAPMPIPDYDRIKRQLVHFYDADVGHRNSAVKAGWKVTERAWFLDELRKAAAHSLLEVGCGTGQDCLFFMENGLKVTGIDLSPRHVEVCRGKGVDARVMDLSSLDFPAGSFDALYSLNTLLHVPKKDLPAVLGGLKPVLKPGGLFYLGVYGGGDVEVIGDDGERFFAFYPFQAYSDILRGYFTIVSSKSISLDPADPTQQFHSFTLAKEA